MMYCIKLWGKVVYTEKGYVIYTILNIQWGLRFKRAEFKRIAGLRDVKIAWHTPLLNRTPFLLNRSYTPPPPPL